MEKEVAVATQIIRPAGLLERLHISRQRLGLGATVLVAAKLSVPNSSQERSLHRDEFYDAVVEAIDQHPALAVRIHNEVENTGPPSLMRMSAVDLDKGIQFLTAEQSSTGFQAAVEDALFKQFDASGEDGPLWRFTVLPDNHVIFLYHHVLGDGQSGLAVLQTIVQALNNNKTTEVSTNAVRERHYAPRQKTDLLPPIEERTNCDITLRTLFHAVIDELLPSWTKNKVWTGNPVFPAVPTPPGRVATRVRIVSLPPDAASRLLAQARSHQTTITSIIHLSAIITLSHLLTEPHVSSKAPSDIKGKDASHTNAKSKYKKIKSHTAVSLRSFANVPSTTMYETASAHDHSENIVSTQLPFPCCASTTSQSWKDDFPWSKASRISKDLKKGGSHARSKLGLLKFLDGKFEGYWEGKLGRKRDESLELSNVGSWSLQSSTQSNGVQDGQLTEKVDSEGKWGVSSAYFAQDDNVVGSAIKVNVIGSPNGELNVCVTWGEGAVDDQLAEAFASGLRHGLEQLSNASP